MTQTKRLPDIDRAKGLGILLVVFGHLAAKNVPAGNLWYAYAQTAVYQFHMPFCMYLSGYVTFLTGSARTEPGRWPVLLQRRASRLLMPFVVFGLLLLAGKMVASHFMKVDNLPPSVSDGLVGMFWATDQSPAISVWYVFTLFVLNVLTAPALWLVRGRTSLLLALAAILYVLPVPHLMYANFVAKFAVFYVLGGIAADAGDAWLDVIDSRTGIALAVFVASVAVALFSFDRAPPLVWLLLCGVLSMPALHAAVRRTALAQSSLLLMVGGYTFVVYLLNTPFIGLMKGLLLKLMPWDGINFLLFAPLMLLAGVLGPIVAKRVVFRRVPALDRITN